MFSYSIAIPAYGRPNELIELFDSIYEMKVLPDEIVICEDFSKERPEINTIVQNQIQKFNEVNVKINYFENEENFGYDKNIRTLINKAQSDWVILIGNDDLFLKNSIQEIDLFCKENSQIKMISRSFLRFEKDITKPIGVSRLFHKNTIIKNVDSPHHIFRMFGFVGGIVINKKWADSIGTNQYDGTLYYQIYLAATAFCENGIGYISNPTVGGRVGNPPMFGSSKQNGEVHLPGSYTAKGRAKMWKGVIEISKNVGAKYSLNLESALRKELTIRQAFHVFEMNVAVKKEKLNELKEELKKLNLFNHWFPKTLYYTNLIFGRKAITLYNLIRKISQ